MCESRYEDYLNFTYPRTTSSPYLTGSLDGAQGSSWPVENMRLLVYGVVPLRSNTARWLSERAKRFINQIITHFCFTPSYVEVIFNFSRFLLVLKRAELQHRPPHRRLAKTQLGGSLRLGSEHKNSEERAGRTI